MWCLAPWFSACGGLVTRRDSCRSTGLRRYRAEFLCAEHLRAFDAGCDDLIINAVVKSEVIVVGAAALVAPGGRHPTGPRAFAFPRFPLTTRLSAA